MDILSALIHGMQMRKQRTQQTRTAMQLLTFSGVVRSSHVELRYATPIATITAFRAQGPAINPAKTRLTSSRPTTQNIALELFKIWQRVRRLSCGLLLGESLRDRNLVQHHGHHHSRDAMTGV